MPLIEINWIPSRGQLRVFGIAALVIFGALGTWLYFSHRIFGLESPQSAVEAIAYGLWIVAALSGILAAAAPAALRPLYILLLVLGAPIGWLVSHVVLAVVFYGILTPIGLALRLCGRDPLRRKFDPQAPSYWADRPPARNVKSYFRQF